MAHSQRRLDIGDRIASVSDRLGGPPELVRHHSSGKVAVSASTAMSAPYGQVGVEQALTPYRGHDVAASRAPRG